MNPILQTWAGSCQQLEILQLQVSDEPCGDIVLSPISASCTAILFSELDLEGWEEFVLLCALPCLIGDRYPVYAIVTEQKMGHADGLDTLLASNF
jgi:hypothetical protein